MTPYLINSFGGAAAVAELPTGTQTVSVATTGTSSKYAVVSTFTTDPMTHEADSISAHMSAPTGAKDHSHNGTAPKGVVCIIVQAADTSDQISGVTYGGVPMTRVVDITHSGGTDSARVYGYFVGSNTVVDVVASAEGASVDDPSLAIVPTVSALIYYGLFHGWEGGQTVQAGSTEQYTTATMGGTSARMSWARKAASGSTTIGFTTAFADDLCHAAVAIKKAA